MHHVRSCSSYNMLGMGGIFWILIGIAILVLIGFIIWQNRPRSQKKVNTALEILNERLARGEIDEAEYQQKRKMME